jgi:hypothetical protein
MHWEIEVADGSTHLIVRTLGLPTIEGFDAVRQAALGHPAYRPGIAIVYDHSGLEGYLSADEVRAIAASAARFERAGPYFSRIAIVSPDPAMFGLTRMWEVYAGDQVAARTRIFESADEADAWLSAVPS